MGEKINAYRFWVEYPERKRLLGSPRRRWEYNIKIDLNKMEWENIKLINVAQDKDILGCCISDNEPSASRKCGEYLTFL
jgi:hypothetical protein